VLRIFVGGSKEHRVPFEVLRHSIMRNATVPVEVKMLGDCDSEERRIPERWRRKAPTSFSFQRFLIPRLCGYEGRAVYLDSDQVVLGDVAELASLAFDGLADPIHSGRAVEGGGEPDATAPKILTTGGWQSAVMILNCAALEWDIVGLCDLLDRGLVRYHDLSALRFMRPGEVAGRIPPEWNCLDASQTKGGVRAKLVHYTDMRSQPWLTAGNPVAIHWYDAVATWLQAADMESAASKVEASGVRKSVFRDALHAGWIRPSLWVLIGENGGLPHTDDAFVFPDDRRKRQGGVL